MRIDDGKEMHAGALHRTSLEEEMISMMVKISQVGEWSALVILRI